MSIATLVAVKAALAVLGLMCGFASFISGAIYEEERKASRYSVGAGRGTAIIGLVLLMVSGVLLFGAGALQ